MTLICEQCDSDLGNDAEPQASPSNRIRNGYCLLTTGVYWGLRAWLAGAPAEGFGVLILLVIGLVSADNFCGTGWIGNAVVVMDHLKLDLVASGSMCAGAPWPTFASVYDDFNAKIVAKVPFQPFWAPPVAINSADSEVRTL